MTGFEGLLTGRTLVGRYTIGEVIGRGGFAAVYEATDERLGRVVAVKVITMAVTGDEAEEVRRRFNREARASASLHHPNVVAVYDFGTDPELGLDFLVMERLRGEDLRARIRRGEPVPAPTALRILREAADGVDAGHRIGLVHRDLKPGNIFLAELNRADWFRVCVVDFGIARIVAGDDTTRITHNGIPLSPAYASPEQISGEREVTPASDVYSLGVIGYELLAGRRPFQGDRLHPPPGGFPAPVPLRELRPDLPAAVTGAIDRALSEDLDERFADAGAFAAALAAAKAELGAGPEEMPRGTTTGAAAGLAASAPEPVASPEPAASPESIAASQPDVSAAPPVSPEPIVVAEPAVSPEPVVVSSQPAASPDPIVVSPETSAVPERDHVEPRVTRPAPVVPVGGIGGESGRAAAATPRSPKSGGRAVALGLAAALVLAIGWFALRGIGGAPATADREAGAASTGTRADGGSSPDASVPASGGATDGAASPAGGAAPAEATAGPGGVERPPEAAARGEPGVAPPTTTPDRPAGTVAIRPSPAPPPAPASSGAAPPRPAPAAPARTPTVAAAPARTTAITAAALNAQGQARFERGDLPGAIERFRRAVQAAPQSAAYRNNLGWALFVAGDLDGAGRELDATLRLDPRRAIAYANLGEVRAARGDTAGAIAGYERFLELNNDARRERIAREKLRRLRGG
jgi:serine/threonine protein kinase